MLPPLVLPHLVPVIPALYRYLARYVVAVAEGLHDPLVFPLYALNGLVDPLQLVSSRMRPSYIKDYKVASIRRRVILDAIG